MAHPTPQQRLSLLVPENNTEEHVAAMLEVEKVTAAAAADPCGCGRKLRRTLYCTWCWREMLATLRNWQ